MQLLDFYQSRFGTAVKRQGGAWNGPCPLCGGDPGKSDRFMVWPDRTENLGEACATHNVAGIWSCRQCGASGDTIAYMMKVEGLDFKSALAELGIERNRSSHRRHRAPDEPRADTSLWAPRECPEPSAVWCDYAAKLLAEAEDRIGQEAQALRWLAGRGISEEAIRAYRIGYLPAEGGKYPGRFRARSAFGLEPRTGDDGTVRTKLFLPRGIMIPTLAADGRVLNLRIRRHKEDLGERSSKYLEVEGSCKSPFLLRSSRPDPLAAYFVTEAELDAILIHHTTGGVVGSVAVRTNRGKPDISAHARLRECVRVCVALDYDGPGADGVEFWEKTYSSARRWPTPEGKDPGDAFRLDVDIRQWVAAALPASIALPMTGRGAECRQDDDEPRSASDAKTTFFASESECPTGRGAERHHVVVQTDNCVAGSLNVGGGVEPQNAPSQGSHPTQAPSEHGQQGGEAFTDTECACIIAALPAYLTLDAVPQEVCRAWLLWQDVPARFTKTLDASGNCMGFEWDFDYTWRRTHEAEFNAFWVYQNSSRILWDWMDANMDATVTARNLLRPWG